MRFLRVILLASKYETKLLLLLLVGISSQLIYFTLRSLVMLFRCGISVHSDRYVCVEAAIFHVK